MAKISLPAIVSQLPGDVRNFLNRLREAFANGAVITADDLASAGLVEVDSNGNMTPLPKEYIDYSIPPVPSGVACYGSIGTIMVQWTNPHYKNFAYAEVWRSAVDNIGTAVLLGTTNSIMYPDEVEPNSVYFYWVRFVSKANIIGPFQGTAGVPGETSIDPEAVIDVLEETELYGPGPFYYQANSTVINGVAVPAGTYIHTAYIARGSIGRLQIGQAVIDDAHVSNMSVNKLTSGTIDGQEITLRDGGHIKGGQTAFNTGNGFYLGIDFNGKALFSVGSPEGAGFDYNQATGEFRFRGIMELRSGSTIGGVSSDILSGWTYSYGRYDFTAGVDGWGAYYGTVTADGRLVLTTNGLGAGSVYRPVNFPGSEYTRIRARIRRASGSDWTGTVTYLTAGNAAGGYGTANVLVLPEPERIDEEFCVLEWDMEQSDNAWVWLGGTIAEIRLILASAVATYEIDWISIEARLPKIDGVNIHASSSIVTGTVVPAAGNRYSVLSGGDVKFYDYYGGGFHEFKSPKKIVQGTCQDGQWVNLGYFREAPAVILSPKSLESYRTYYSGSDQRFILDAINLQKSGDDWWFQARCQLQVSAASGTGAASGWGLGTPDTTDMNSMPPIHVYSPTVALPYGNTKSVSCGVQSLRQFIKSWWNVVSIWNDNLGMYEDVSHYVQTINQVYGQISLQYYTAASGWIDSGSQSVGGWAEYPQYNDFPFTVTSANDILYVRAHGYFYYPPYPMDLPYDNYNNTTDRTAIASGVRITWTSFNLQGTTISLNGQANYMAIGG